MADRREGPGGGGAHRATHCERTRPLTRPRPPDDPAELVAFPARTVPADYPYSRVHHDRHEPEWFCNKGDCRFDPPPGAGFGTCYLAGHPLGAFVEKFGRLKT